MIKPMLTKTQNENEMKMKFRLFLKKSYHLILNDNNMYFSTLITFLYFFKK